MSWRSNIEGFILYLKLERGFAENTQKGYHSDIWLFAEFMMNQKIFEPSRSTESDIQKFLQNYFTEHKATSQSRVLYGIKSFFAWLHLENRIKNNPAKNIESPKLEFKIPKYLEYEDIKKIIDSISLKNFFGIRDKAIIETLYATGIRASECCDLKLSNLFFSQSYIRVIGKGNKERLVPIAQSSLDTIQLYLHSRIKYPAKAKSQEYVFLSSSGNKLNKSLLQSIINKIAKNANLSIRISPHIFRHSCATHLVQNGMSILELKEMLGHKNITTTEIYLHTNVSYLKATIDQYHPRNSK